IWSVSGHPTLYYWLTPVERCRSIVAEGRTAPRRQAEAQLGDRWLPVLPRRRPCPMYVWMRGGWGTHLADTLRYSITSSARASRACGTVRRSAFAVFRLTIIASLTDCCTGISAGFSPFSIRAI